MTSTEFSGTSSRKIGRLFAITSLLAIALSGVWLSAANSAIEPAQLALRISQDNAPTILDVRTEQEYRQGHVTGALNIPHNELANKLTELAGQEGSELVVYCERGPRAAVAREILVAAGFVVIITLDGHMNRWRREGYPLEIAN